MKYDLSIDRSVLANICAIGVAKNLPTAIQLVKDIHKIISHISYEDTCESRCRNNYI